MPTIVLRDNLFALFQKADQTTVDLRKGQPYVASDEDWAVQSPEFKALFDIEGDTGGGTGGGVDPTAAVAWTGKQGFGGADLPLTITEGDAIRFYMATTSEGVTEAEANPAFVSGVTVRDDSDEFQQAYYFILKSHMENLAGTSYGDSEISTNLYDDGGSSPQVNSRISLQSFSVDDGGSVEILAASNEGHIVLVSANGQSTPPLSISNQAGDLLLELTSDGNLLAKKFNAENGSDYAWLQSTTAVSGNRTAGMKAYLDGDVWGTSELDTTYTESSGRVLSYLSVSAGDNNAEVGGGSFSVQAQPEKLSISIQAVDGQNSDVISVRRSNGLNMMKVDAGGKTYFDEDVELTTLSKGIILKSPDGTRYRVAVADGGTLSVQAV